MYKKAGEHVAERRNNSTAPEQRSAKINSLLGTCKLKGADPSPGLKMFLSFTRMKI